MSLNGYRQIFAAGASLGLLVSPVAIAREVDTLEFRCTDLVIVGRFKTVSYTDQSTDDDLLGHGRFEYRVNLRRILYGAEKRKVVAASGVSHVSFVNGRDFLLVLSPIEQGGYAVQRAALWRSRDRPRIAAECTKD